MARTEAQKRAASKYRQKTYELRVAIYPPDKDIAARLDEISGTGEADIREREKYERWLSRQSDMLEDICRERGIALWEEYTENGDL